MEAKRVYHSLRLKLMRNPRKKAAYLKKHHLLAAIGENCIWGPARLPLYSQLIRLHNNVSIHKTAVIIPHDMVNGFLKRARPDMDFGHRERIGCVEIMDNVYVGNHVIILPDVRIGKNCIISTGSVVTQDIPENSVVGGHPARVVGRFDIFCAMRRARGKENVRFPNQKLPDELAKETWERFERKHAERESMK